MQVKVLFAGGAFAESALVAVNHFKVTVGFVTLVTLFTSVADTVLFFVGGFFPILALFPLVVFEASGAEKFSAAIVALHLRLLSSLRQLEILTSVLVTSVTFLTGASVVSRIIVVEALFASYTKKVSVEETFQGVASMIVFAMLNQNETLVFWLFRPLENNLIAMLDGHHHDLVFHQVSLEFLQFVQTTRSFRHAG